MGTTILGIDPGLNDIGLAWVVDGVLVGAELLPVLHNANTPKYIAAADRVLECLEGGTGADWVFVERPGIHGVQKRGKKIAGTERRGDVTYNWTVIEDLIAVSERLQLGLGGEPAYVIGRKGATDWSMKSWCGRQSKEARHLELTLESTKVEQEIARAAAGSRKSKLHNVLDAWCIARWAARHV